MKNSDSEKLGYRATTVSAISDVALAAGKFVAGTLGNSSALIADALHSVSDLATDFISYVSIKVAHTEPDAEHPYGHGMAETIGTAGIGLIVSVIGMGIMWEEQKHFLSPSSEIAAPTMLALAAALASIVVKEILFFYTLAVGKKIGSESVIANAWHHRSDALSSLAAAVGIIGALMGYRAMDPIAAIIVGLLILHMGWKILWEAVQNLMERGLSEEKLRETTKMISSVPGVIHYHDVRTRKAGRDIFVDAHIQVQPRLSASEAHNIAESVRRELKQRSENIADAMIHIDVEDDGEGRLYRDKRAEVEGLVNRVLEANPGLGLASPVVIHYSLHQAAAEISLEPSADLTPGSTEAAAKEIMTLLAERGGLTEIVIRQNVGRWRAEEDGPPAVKTEGGNDGRQ
ncbi:MAG: cation transporter [Nitrospinae bacterium]|nr:cation transporter [Nitrospinota bacterium]